MTSSNIVHSITSTYLHPEKQFGVLLVLLLGRYKKQSGQRASYLVLDGAYLSKLSPTVQSTGI
jgi:hypothetical protein